eukprot:scaffold99931_cov22-Prasinocladus_malaysianus.AAC.2
MMVGSSLGWVLDAIESVVDPGWHAALLLSFDAFHGAESLPDVVWVAVVLLAHHKRLLWGQGPQIQAHGQGSDGFQAEGAILPALVRT